MPAEVIHCVLCDRRERGARSKFTTITTMERQQKVYEAYEKRHGQPLNYSLINKKVHCSCYRALTFSFTPVPVVNRTGRPKLYKRPRRCNLTTTNTSTIYQSSFTNIQRNYSQQNETQSSSIELNVNMEMFNDYYSEEENDNILHNHLMTTIEDTSSLNICSSSCHQQPLVDRSNQDIELDVRIGNNGSSLQLNNIDIFPMSSINKNRTSNITFATNDLNAQCSNIINVISAAAVDDDNFEIASMTPGGTQADDDNHNCQSSEDEDCYIEITPTIFSSNSIQNNSMTPGKINSNEEDEYVILKNKYEKKKVRAYRAKTGTTSSSRRSHRIQSKFHEAPPCPQIKNCSGLFTTAFDELCSWLIDLLHSGLIVSMIDISTEYRIIAERRKENAKANMFRTSSIQKRFKFKYGDKLYFYKQSNNEGVFVGLSDPCFYVRNAVSKLKVWKRTEPPGVNKKELCEKFIEVIEQLRLSIKNYIHIFRSMKNDKSSLINFDSDLFWSCIPLLLKNFIGILTLNDGMFSKMKKEYEFYDIQTKDLFRNSSKWLKIASICYDVIYATNNHNITPKHYLLGNELYRHERSEQLLTITNRLGHTPSYDTIVRLHVDAAKRSQTGSKPSIYPRQEISPGDHNFIIIISTPENNELPVAITDCINDLLNKIMNSIISTTNSSSYLFSRMEKAFAVTRSHRKFSIHGRNNDNTIYQLRGDDRLQLSFRQFVHCNRVALAKCIRQCWMEPDLIKYLPLGRLLVVGGPDTTAVKLQNGQAPQVDYLLESNHSESRTRLLLHTNIISLDQLQKTVIIDTTDTDVILLAIALGSTIMLNHLIIKSTNTRTKKNTFIDVKSIATGLRRAAIDPTCLLVLHSLSGCDTTSFIKNITKEKVFSCFFDYPDQYSSINKLNCIPPPYEAIAACEQLLIHCYSFGRMVHSLDELRAMMAEVRMKDRTRTNIASSLPPSTSSFHHHCLRAARQVKIWLDCLDLNPTTPSMLDSGYKNVDGIDRFKIKWNDLPDQPSDFRLITCGDCKSNCRRCKCWKNNISCTIYCKCNVDSCINQPSAQSITSLTSNDFRIDDSSDDERSTDASIQSNRECDDDSFMSESDSIYNQTDDSKIYMDNYDRTSDELNLNNCVIHTSTAALQDNLSLHILHDHNYSIDDSNNDSILNFFSTPKRRRTATMTSDIYDTSTPCSSPLIHSTPKTQTTTSSTTTIFKTLEQTKNVRRAIYLPTLAKAQATKVPHDKENVQFIPLENFEQTGKNAQIDETILNKRPQKTDIAVIMYTSGSTGTPKG
ncbi:unnamed protein product [Rotaria sordida]|uniref:AMP-dependent synthetase/ligase domain-containing protein n=1 Tax=Rotaria sordida TaxID=392033 RepID=A0A818GIQ4_9BILA|nr:unnamed protein product [Rotaria sordida]